MAEAQYRHGSVRQAVFRALGAFRRPFVALAFLGLAVGGALLVRLPLLGLPGYELAATLSLLHGLTAWIFGLATARAERRLIQSRDPRPRGAVRFDSALRSVLAATFGAWLLSLAALCVPFAAAVPTPRPRPRATRASRSASSRCSPCRRACSRARSA
jgi:hypothetical protein